MASRPAEAGGDEWHGALGLLLVVQEVKVAQHQQRIEARKAGVRTLLPVYPPDIAAVVFEPPMQDAQVMHA